MKSYKYVLAFVLVFALMAGCAILERDYVISGRVQDEQGKGLEGIVLSIEGEENSILTTDSAGNWDARVEGPVTIRPVSDSHSFTPPKLEAEGEAKNLIFTLQTEVEKTPSIEVAVEGLMVGGTHVFKVDVLQIHGMEGTMQYSLLPLGRDRGVVKDLATTSYALTMEESMGLVLVDGQGVIVGEARLPFGSYKKTVDISLRDDGEVLEEISISEMEIQENRYLASGYLENRDYDREDIPLNPTEGVVDLPPGYILINDIAVEFYYAFDEKEHFNELISDKYEEVDYVFDDFHLYISLPDEDTLFDAKTAEAVSAEEKESILSSIELLHDHENPDGAPVGNAWANVSVEVLTVGPSTIYRVWVHSVEGLEGAQSYTIQEPGETSTPFGVEISRITIEDTMPVYILDEPPGDEPTLFTLSMKKEGQGSVEPEVGDYSFEDGTLLTAVATAASGWDFSHWEGDVEGSNNEIDILMDRDREVKAVFTEEVGEYYTLTVHVLGEGTVHIDPLQPSYEAGSTVELTAIPDTGHEFSHWTGDSSGSDNPLQVVMDGDREIFANFQPIGMDSMAIYSLDLSSGQSSFTLENYGSNERAAVILFPRDESGSYYRVGSLATGLYGVSMIGEIRPFIDEDVFFWEDSLEQISFTSFFREKERETRQKHDMAREVPGRLPIKSPSIGDTDMFHILPEDDTRQATLVGMNDKALLWVTDNTSVSSSDVQYYLNAFAGFYDDLLDYFGRVPSAATFPILQGQDDRINILFSTFGPGGYFYSADLYSQAIYPYSNERRIFYINSEMPRDYTTGTIAHEFQHMLFYNEAVLAGRSWFVNDIWINEGFSQLAEDIAGYGFEHGVGGFTVDAYLDATWETSLLGWENAIADYGGTYLFARYIYDRYGSSILSSVSTHGGHPKDAIESYAGMAFYELFQDWAITMFGNVLDWDFDYPYVYDTIELPTLRGYVLEPGQGWEDWWISGWGIGYTLIGPGTGNNLVIEVDDAAVSGEYRQTIIRRWWD